MPAEIVVVVERVGPAGRYVGIGREIALCVEQRVRIAPFVPELLEMPEWFDVRRRDIGVVRQVIDVVEAVRCGQRGERDRLAPLARSKLEKVRERIDGRGRDIRIGAEERRNVECRRGLASLGPSALVEVRQRIDLGLSRRH